MSEAAKAFEKNGSGASQAAKYTSTESETLTRKAGALKSSRNGETREQGHA